MYTKCFHTKCIPYFDKLLYTFCIQNVYKMYTECLYTKCIPHLNKLLYTFCIQNLADIVLLILYTKCIQKLVEMVAYILYTSIVYILHNFCKQNAYTVSMWEPFVFFLQKKENLAKNVSIPVSLVDLLQ